MSLIASNDNGEETPDRIEILSVLGRRIDEIEEHLNEMDASTDAELQIRWTKTLGYLVDQYRKLKKDVDLDVMEAEVKSLAEEFEK